MASLFESQGRRAEAETLYKRSLAIREKQLGRDHPRTAQSLSNLAALAYHQGEWVEAATHWRLSIAAIKRRSERGLTEARPTEGSFGREARGHAAGFRGFIRAAYRIAVQGPSPVTMMLASETFETAQWVQGSEAAVSLAQMAVRSAQGSPQLAQLVRERQDLVSEWEMKDKQLMAAKNDAPAKRKADGEGALGNRLADIDRRLEGIDGRLANNFPNYTALASPAPVSVTEVQAQLRADEALVLFLDVPALKPTRQETFIWVVTKSDMRWVRSELGTAALAREVTALRCGLDGAAWFDNGAEQCSKLLEVSSALGSNPLLPFDHARAHKLYVALFGEVQDLVAGKHLLIVPSGPLTQLPFQVLITKQPTSSDHREAAWLAREHAITVLPAVSSLKALRRIGKSSAATKPMIGFGNPLLNGPDPSYAHHAQLAREKERCNARPQRRVALADLLESPVQIVRFSAPRLSTRRGAPQSASKS